MSNLVALPSTIDIASGDSAVLGAIPANLAKRTIEPVGRYFQAYFNRKRHNRTVTEQEAVDKAKNAVDAVEVDSQDDEVETAALLRLDPSSWKEQDHYAVMGLSRLRFRATEEDLKKAFRKKVLKHHPDKKAAANHGKTDDDKFFKCVQKAYDLLMNPELRRQFDSVDPSFDETIPNPKKEVKPEDFFKVYGPVFERNARFSKIQPVPLLGDESTATLAEVEEFYGFWYNFDSWRIFNYQDEEEGSGGDDQNRDNKRYLDKKNKKQREEKKNEDNKRLRRLTEQAQALDPRIKRLMAEEKERKAREKEAKNKSKFGGAVVNDEEKAAAEAAAKAEAERLAAEKAAKEEEEKKSKLDKDAKKKALQKDRKTFRRVLKQSNYFQLPDAPLATAIEVSEKIAETYEELSALTALMIAEPRAAWGNYMKVVAKIAGEAAVTAEPPYVEPVQIAEGEAEESSAKKPAAAAVAATAAPQAKTEAPKKAAEPAKKEAPKKAAEPAKKEEPKKAAEPAKKEEPKKAAEPAKPVPAAAAPSSAEPAKKAEGPTVDWTDKEVALLIEAVKKFPGGTVSRWKKVLDHINNHSGAPVPKKEKDVIEKSKNIQSNTGISVPTDTHIKIEKKHTDTVVTDKPTIRDDVVDTPSAPVKSEKKTAADFVDENWTLEQVEALYKALASISADSDNRWDKIAAAVPGKDKKDCQSKVKKIQQASKK